MGKEGLEKTYSNLGPLLNLEKSLLLRLKQYFGASMVALDPKGAGPRANPTIASLLSMPAFFFFFFWLCSQAAAHDPSA